MPKPNKRLKRELKPRFHIFCEGEKTEPNYLRKYINRQFPGTRLIIVEEAKKNTPVELVEEAIQAKRDGLEGDIFWVVYDREGRTKYSDKHHAEAQQKADGKSIHVALSNVCFEVWLLLHFQKDFGPFYDCSDLLKKSDLKKKFIPNYDKASNRSYSDEEITKARKNAEHMNLQTKKGAPSGTYRYQWNPYTDVHKLLDAIDKFGSINIK